MGNKDRLRGKIQTVTGLIEPSSLGVTLMHEHLMVDYAKNYGLPVAESSRATIGGLTLEQQQHLWLQPLTLQNVGHVRSYFNQNKDNMILNDVHVMCEEMSIYKARGGSSLVECSVDGMSRNPIAMKKISEITGVNIVMGTGFYLAGNHPPDMDHRTVELIADTLLSEINEGVDGGICAGIIGELGCSTNLAENEIKVLKAAAIAQRETGLPISIHPGYSIESPFQIVDILKSEGADLSRVIIGHMDRGVISIQAMIELAKKGCILEFDQFGWGCSMVHALSHGMDYPSDFTRCHMIRELRDYGFLKQVVMSHDIAFKTRLVKYGGEGYEYLLKNIVPFMLKRGLTQDDVNTMMIENPKRLLTVQ
ncbi:N-acetyltaurine hydrolase-like [Saccoglossus kowalevskii]|uniref:Phosphotriesterase-related protein-like n=1 Tax=Saccoglossus kowalevskii TaxID=10224 RepID=A0ABM0GWS4_SACKO|nr:PREDICTED: phosphotriesterase-related protein-like [Saccoglossus kowalevskii]